MTWRPLFRATTGMAVALVLATAGLLGADTGFNHQLAQPRPIALGTSGGNINDHSNTFCCSGTLGALVTKNGTQYVLSNNHVLARSNSGRVGDLIIQPGLIDQAPVCATDATDAVATLSQWATITFKKGTRNVVDGAIAEVQGGKVAADGSIVDIGVVSATPAVAAINMPVMKSGRTTGLTSGLVAAVNVTISVRYGSSCGGGRGTATFKNQMRVTPGTFSDGGDSGSLIVTSGAPAQPVGLLFAGSSTDTFANPIQSVLDAFGVTVVGTASTAGRFPRWLTRLVPGVARAQAAGPAQPVTPASQRAADQAKERHEQALLGVPGVVGVGVGASETVAGEAVVEVYVERDTPAVRSALPGRVDGVPVKIVETGQIHARGACAVRDATR